MSLNSLEIQEIANTLPTRKINQSDCEIQIIDGRYQVSNIDSVSEEIELQLYTSPELIGHMGAVACLSDFAAAGIAPTTILQCVTWDRKIDQTFKLQVMKSYLAVLEKFELELAGGDTSYGPFTSIATAGFACVEYNPQNRLGSKPGDLICMIGELGSGPSLVFRYLLGLSEDKFPENYYRPFPKLVEGIALRDLITASIDTSDGVITCLNHLALLNNIQFEINIDQASYCSQSLEFIKSQDIPKFLLWLAEHGDYQLIVTIPEKNFANAKAICPNLVSIGKVTSSKKSTFAFKDQKVSLHTNDIVDVLFKRRHEPQNLLEDFCKNLKHYGKLI